MTNASAGSPGYKVDTEVVARPRRRKFKAVQEKSLVEADAVAGTGDTAFFASESGSSSSTFSNWRREREAAVHEAFSRRRGPEPQRNPFALENQKLRDFERALAGRASQSGNHH